jgi:mono/diheme cytochrome c family protein
MSQMAFEGPLNASPARTLGEPVSLTLPEVVDADRGRMLYAANCASCHGPRGGGDGPGAASLLPAPSDLSAHEYTSARLAAALWNGVKGTAMSGWRDHSRDDLAAIAAFVQGLHTPQDVAVPGSLTALGAQVYAANCVQCHGPDGDGDGFAASELSIAPPSFRTQRPSLALSLRIIRDGVRGTRMAAWTGRLSEAEIVAVAHHVRQFFQRETAR